MVHRHGDQQRIRVLFLAANPDTSLRLRLDREVRRIEEKLRAGTGGGALDLVTRWAVRPDDLQQAMLKVRPGIVHFSCHGTEAEEIVLEDEEGAARCVGKEALARLFGVLKDEIRVVFLNACHSRPQAEAITRHVDCAIGMRRGVGDAAAIAFAAAFYQALAFGRSVREAFDLGLITLELEGISRDAAPELVLREGVDAGQLYVCQRRHCSSAALPLPAPFAAPSPYQIPMMSGIISVPCDPEAPVRPSPRDLPPWAGGLGLVIGASALVALRGLDLITAQTAQQEVIEAGFVAVHGARAMQFAIALGLSATVWLVAVAAYRHRRLVEYRTAEQAYLERISGASAFVEQSMATLYLRVVGTPHAYRAPEGAERITIGRQRRKAGQGPEQGNDVVIRLQGDDQGSLRISRRHLEIKRVGRNYVAIDRSLGATALNGERMPTDQPVLVRPGDQLTLAAVLSLELVVTDVNCSGMAQPEVHVDTPGVSSGVIIEASIGDMLTVRDDEHHR